MYEISELIDERNHVLFNEIASTYDITIVKSTDDFWTSRLDGDKVEISFTNSKCPQACFTHELLHIKLRQQGYATPFFNPGQYDTGNIKDLISFFDDFLQHIKIYDDFISLGYSRNLFLNDNDSSDMKKVWNDVLAIEKKVFRGTIQKPKAFSALILPLITASTPPETSMTKKILNKMKTLVDNNSIESFRTMTINWENDQTSNPTEYFKKLFQFLNMKGITLSQDPNGIDAVET